MSCDNCGRSRDGAGGWTFTSYPGPKPPENWRTERTLSFSGYMCGDCASKHIYESQQAFEDYVRLRPATKALTPP
jgi:hypothetical protein